MYESHVDNDSNFRFYKEILNEIYQGDSEV